MQKERKVLKQIQASSRFLSICVQIRIGKSESKELNSSMTIYNSCIILRKINKDLKKKRNQLLQNHH
jgi:hypothetical protein